MKKNSISNKIVVIIFFAILVPTTIFSLVFNVLAEKNNITVATQNEIAQDSSSSQKKYIKWAEFHITNQALQQAYDIDIATYKKDIHIDWIDILAYLGAKYGGDFSRYKYSDMTKYVERVKKGEKIEDITKDMQYYSYYSEVYRSILGEYVGEYSLFMPEKNTSSDSSSNNSSSSTSSDIQNSTWKTTYGLKVYSPIAEGFYFSHYDDFCANRSYGYARKHLGHDLMCSIGTPIIAVESGTITECGWNQYGGWRVGITSFDGKRYYYYAHMRKDHPYHPNTKLGATVKAGDVIGYVGRTGYSTSENVNNITENHLHFGIQLIFDDSQKDGNNEIWIDLYELTKFLSQHQSTVCRVEGEKEYYRKFDYREGES